MPAAHLVGGLFKVGLKAYSELRHNFCHNYANAIATPYSPPTLARKRALKVRQLRGRWSASRN